MSRLYQVNLRRVSSKSINLHQKHDNWLLFLQNKREEGKVAVGAVGGGGGEEKEEEKEGGGGGGETFCSDKNVTRTQFSSAS